VWSPVQALLDIKAISDAWEATQPVEGSEAISRATSTIDEVIQNNCLFAETADTLMNMKLNYQSEVLLRRFQTSETWQNAGRPEELDAIEQKHAELIAQWDYHPPQEKLHKIMDIYHKLCNTFNIEPLKID
jgi:hypothetical protein